MAWVATAVSAYGVYSASKSSDKAASAQGAASASQAEAMDKQTELQGEALDFEMAKHEEWQSIFGDVQEQLSQYYEDYDADTIEALGVQNIEKEYATSKQNLTRSLAQRGISGSGTEAAALTALESQRALGAAGVRAAAPHQAMQAKEGFLSLGLGQGSDRSNVSGVLQNMATVQGQQATAYGQQASAYGQQAATAGQAFGSNLAQLTAQLTPQIGSTLSGAGTALSGWADNTFAYTTPTASGGYSPSSAYDETAGYYSN